MQGDGPDRFLRAGLPCQQRKHFVGAQAFRYGHPVKDCIPVIHAFQHLPQIRGGFKTVIATLKTGGHSTYC